MSISVLWIGKTSYLSRALAFIAEASLAESSEMLIEHNLISLKIQAHLYPSMPFTSPPSDHGVVRRTHKNTQIENEVIIQ